MKLSKEVVSYLVFGVLTTIVNIVSYAFLIKIAHMDYKLAVTVAWFVSVLFAFFTNKVYVFNSKTKKLSVLVKEIFSFVLFRIFSLVIDLVLMILFVEWLELEDLLSKIIANIFVIVINYVASKYFIFKTKS